MGIKLSAFQSSVLSALPQMAEANIPSSDGDSSVSKYSCESTGSEVTQTDLYGPSTSKAKSHRKSFPLVCKKKSKAKEETEEVSSTKIKGERSKNKSGWTLRWRMKSPKSTEDEVSGSESPREPMINLDRFNPEDYPIEDRDEMARLVRAREIAEGIEMEIDSLPPCYRGQREGTADNSEASVEEPTSNSTAAVVASSNTVPVARNASDGAVLFDGLTVLLHRSLAISIDSQRAWNVLSQLDLRFLAQHYNWHQGSPGMFTLTPRAAAAQPSLTEVTLAYGGSSTFDDTPQLAHTQVDYLHCLVPDLLDITKCSFYWGKMDRYEAERLLENKPDGTFLLRDSAQEEYLFSVSFRRYNRSLHARIEQWNHRFSFDSHDPGVFSSSTILGLIDHYKNPELCMFFEPTLTLPLHRNAPFSLQHLSRAVISSTITYDGIGLLDLPKPLKLYLKEYHYKQRIRVRRLDL